MRTGRGEKKKSTRCECRSFRFWRSQIKSKAISLFNWNEFKISHDDWISQFCCSLRSHIVEATFFRFLTRCLSEYAANRLFESDRIHQFVSVGSTCFDDTIRSQTRERFHACEPLRHTWCQRVAKTSWVRQLSRHLHYVFQLCNLWENGDGSNIMPLWGKKYRSDASRFKALSFSRGVCGCL